MGKEPYWFIGKWKKEMARKIKLAKPDIDEDKLDKYLNERIEATFKDPKCKVRNTYKGEEVNTSLMNIMQFIHDRKPIMAGFGLLFKNQEDMYNPNSNMLMESINTRKRLKKERAQYDKRSYEFLMKDIGQGNEKVIANSFYGANGTKTSMFFNRDIATSITATGQAEIATAETSFEMFLANNVKFFDLDECLLFITRVQQQEYTMKIPKLENAHDKVYEKLLYTCKYPASINQELLRTVVNQMSEEDCVKVYYKNNLIPFLRDYKPARAALEEAINTTKTFRDPNDVPSGTKAILDVLWDYIKEFVVYDWPVRNRIERDKYEPRKACVIQDTDSTMLTLLNVIEFMNDEIAADEVAAETEEDFNYILVNIVCYILTRYQSVFFGRYCSDCNIPKDYHWMINMKNEFYYPMVLTTKAKKHYITLTKLQEGKEIDPPKIEIHGLDIAKAETSTYTYDFFFSIIRDDIMYTDKINVGKILRKIQEFKKAIRASIEAREKRFLPLKSVKEVEAYAQPYSEQGIRAVRTWNLLNPDLQVNLPDKVLALAIRCKKEKDYQEYKHYIPGEYQEIIEREIFNSDNKSIKGQGFNIIAIPQTVDLIPEWLIPLVDYDKIINDNVSKFNSILESLGNVMVDTRSNDSHGTNIISF
jgi:hypothetical protein